MEMSELLEEVSQFDWSAYYNAVANRPPRPTLLAALERFEPQTTHRTRLAVDLGCGKGRDTIELLRREWRVLGIDAEEEAISRLLSREVARCEALETQICRLEEFKFPPDVDLTNGEFEGSKFPIALQYGDG